MLYFVPKISLNFQKKHKSSKVSLPLILDGNYEHLVLNIPINFKKE